MATSPDGVITFISSILPGSTSDKELTGLSGILEPVDSDMTDPGFDIEEDCSSRCAA